MIRVSSHFCTLDNTRNWILRLYHASNRLSLRRFLKEKDTLNSLLVDPLCTALQVNQTIREIK